MKVDEFKDQLQILKNTNESNKKTIFNMSNSILTSKKLFNKILSSQELPLYLSDKMSRKPWNFKLIFFKMLDNKCLKQGDKNKLGDIQATYKEFQNLQALEQTFPQKIIKTFNEFIANHDIILPSVFPGNSGHRNYFFDWYSAFFNGTYLLDDYVIIEQQQTNKPLIKIFWKADMSPQLIFSFYHSSKLKYPEYSVYITKIHASLDEHKNNKFLIRYRVNQDGSLGEKII